MCSYYRPPTYHAGPNSLGTVSCLYSEVEKLESLEFYKPMFRLHWGSGGETFEAGTRVFMEVYE